MSKAGQPVRNEVLELRRLLTEYRNRFGPLSAGAGSAAAGPLSTTADVDPLAGHEGVLPASALTGAPVAGAPLLSPTSQQVQRDAEAAKVAAQLAKVEADKRALEKGVEEKRRETNALAIQAEGLMGSTEGHSSKQLAEVSF